MPAPAITERAAQSETLTGPEIGELAHGEISDIINGLPGVPEYLAGLHRDFFGRSFPNGGRAIIADGVDFRKGDYYWHVSFHAEPLRFGPEEVRTYDARVRLGLTQYGKANSGVIRSNL